MFTVRIREHNTTDWSPSRIAVSEISSTAPPTTTTTAPATTTTTTTTPATTTTTTTAPPNNGGTQSQLRLSDFDREGLEVEALALFTAGEAGSAPALYSASGSRWTASGSLLAGDAAIGPDQEAIVRIMHVMSEQGNSTLRLNDGGPLVLGDYFGSGGAGHDLTVWVQTAGGTTSFAASSYRSVGGNYINFGLSSQTANLIADISAGDRFILALTRPGPELTISRDQESVTEGETAQFTITSDRAVSTDLTVKTYQSQNGGFATWTGPGTVTMPKGSTSARAAITTVEDSTEEDTGSVTMTLKDGTGYTADSTASAASVTVIDKAAADYCDIFDCSPTITVYPVADSITEGEYAKFRIDSTSSTGVKVCLRYGDGGSDYGVPDTSNWTNAPRTSFAIATDQDDVGEIDGYVWFEIRPSSDCDGGDYIIGSPQGAQVKVLDNDAPEISIAAAASQGVTLSVVEGYPAVFTIRADPAPSDYMTVDVIVTQQGLFTSYLGDRSITFSPGDGSVEFRVATIDDHKGEDNGSVTVTVTEGSDYTLGQYHSDTVPVSDDDGGSCGSKVSTKIGKGSLTLKKRTYKVFGKSWTSSQKNLGVGGWTLAWDPCLDFEDNVIKNFSTNLAAPFKGEVFICWGHSICESVNRAIVAANRCLDDGAEKMVRWGLEQIRDDEDVDSGFPDLGECNTQSWDDDTPTFTVSAHESTVTEGDEVRFNFAWTTPNNQNPERRTVDLRIETVGSFLEETPPSTHVLGKNDAFSHADTYSTLKLDTDNDNTVESSGTVKLTILPGDDYAVGAAKTATVTVLDDDEAVTFTSTTPAPVVEGDQLTFSVSVTNHTGSGYLSVSVTETGNMLKRGTGHPPSDVYISNGSGTLYVDTVNDGDAESPSTISVTSTDSRIGKSNTASVTVADNDQVAPILKLYRDQTQIIEGSTASWTIESDKALPSQLTVKIDQAEDGDYATETVSSVTMDAGTDTKTVSVLTDNDSEDETDGSITLTLKSGTGYGVGTTNLSTKIDVQDDDPTVTKPTVWITGSGTAVTEGDSINYEINRSGVSGNVDVEVSVTETGSMVHDDDDGTRTLSAPSSRLVRTIGDSDAESDSYVTISIVDDDSYTVSGSDLLVRVKDNDVAALPVITVSRHQSSVTEGGTVYFRVHSNMAVPANLSVGFSRSQSGSFASWSGSGTVTISSGGTQSGWVSVSTVNDSTDEANGSLTMSLNSGTGYTVGSPSSATVTVRDNDVAALPVITVSRHQSSVTEGGTVYFRVHSNMAVPANLSVGFSRSQSGSFASWSGSGTVTISSGGTQSGWVSVSTVNDSTVYFRRSERFAHHVFEQRHRLHGRFTVVCDCDRPGQRRCCFAGDHCFPTPVECDRGRHRLFPGPLEYGGARQSVGGLFPITERIVRLLERQRNRHHFQRRHPIGLGERVDR